MAGLAKGSEANTSQERAMVYLLGPSASRDEAEAAARAAGVAEPMWLGRRGYGVGWVGQRSTPGMPSAERIAARWQASQGVVLPGFVKAELAAESDHIHTAHDLMAKALEGREIASLFEAEPYASRLAPRFELLAATVDEGDDQEIETIEFDAVEAGELAAEGLWVKASWLSFDEADLSLRFRFSFGLVGYEDVAADFNRQRYAAQLTEAIFPESALISANRPLHDLLARMLGVDQVAYVERIVYFNAPDGGAQMHQDVERGHAGVVYAQLSGATVWFALAKSELIDEIQRFMARDDADVLLAEVLTDGDERATLRRWCASSGTLQQMLDERDNDPLEALINRVPEFARQLVEAGHASVLHPGDLMLLPQQSLERCAWHSVYCLGDEPGEALSFAVRAVTDQ